MTKQAASDTSRLLLMTYAGHWQWCRGEVCSCSGASRDAIKSAREREHCWGLGGHC